jgi:hypothetical protein
MAHNFPFCIQPIFQGTAFSTTPLDIQLIGPYGNAPVQIVEQWSRGFAA